MLADAAVAAATVALAVVGAISLIFNIRIVRAVERQAEATRAEAEATRQEAAASMQLVEEVRRDREIGVQPVLVVERRPEFHLRDPLAEFSVLVTNHGRGPALTCLYLGYGRSEAQAGQDPPVIRSWYLSDTFSLSANAEREMTAERVTELMSHILIGLRDDDQVGMIDVVVCRDQFGHKYRFSNRRDTPDISRADSPSPAPWAASW